MMILDKIAMAGLQAIPPHVDIYLRISKSSNPAPTLYQLRDAANFYVQIRGGTLVGAIKILRAGTTLNTDSEQDALMLKAKFESFAFDVETSRQTLGESK